MLLQETTEVADSCWILSLSVDVLVGNDQNRSVHPRKVRRQNPSEAGEESLHRSMLLRWHVYPYHYVRGLLSLNLIPTGSNIISWA